MFEILEKLCGIRTAPGAEGEMLAFIENEIGKYCDEVVYDNMGNLVAVCKSEKPNAKKLMLCTYCDASGYIVNYIEENGYLRLTKLGNPGAVSTAYTPINVGGKAWGYIAVEKGAEIKDGDYSKLYADIGAKSRIDAEKHVKLGDICTLIPDIKKLCGTIAGGAELSSRLGTAILLEIMKNADKSEYDLYFAFTVQENLMHRGAKTVAFDIKPDLCICIDVCESYDTQGANRRGEAVLGDGAVIMAKNADFCANPILRERLESLSEKQGIKSKTCVYAGQSTAASVISKCAGGVPSACICVPVRNIGSGAEIFDMSDTECATGLIGAFIKEKI